MASLDKEGLYYVKEDPQLGKIRGLDPWAVENGIISGSLEGGKTYLDPKGDATRAQVASVLMRYLKTFG